MKLSKFLFFAMVLLSIGCKNRYSDDPRDLSIFERIAHEFTDDEKMEEFIDSLMLRMTLTEKIGQMTQLNESFFDVDNNLTGYRGVDTDISYKKELFITVIYKKDFNEITENNFLEMIEKAITFTYDFETSCNDN